MLRLLWQDQVTRTEARDVDNDTVFQPPATQSRSCEVAGGHDYVYKK